MSIILIVIASICAAIMDVLSHHYPRSIFKNLKSSWWNPKNSWKNKYSSFEKDIRKEKVFYAFCDAWHTFRNIYVFSIIAAIAFFPFLIIEYSKYQFLDFVIIWFLALYFIYLLTYFLFYKLILIKKK